MVWKMVIVYLAGRVAGKELEMLDLNDEKYDEAELCTDCNYYGEPAGCNRNGGTCKLYDAFMDLKEECNFLQCNDR